MKTIKIAFAVLLSAISSTVYCALYTVVNNGNESVMVNLDVSSIDKTAFSPKRKLTLAATVKPGESTRNGFDAKGGRYADQIYLTKPGEKALLRLANSNSNILSTNFNPKNVDYTIILTNSNGLWTIRTQRSK